MKKNFLFPLAAALFIMVLITIAIMNVHVFAGELRTLPQYLVLNDPTSNQVEAITLTHYYNATSPYAIMTLHVLDNNGVRDRVSVHIRNEVDDPETPEDETTTTYTDFVAGYGATMKTRADALAWQRLQELYDIQATP